MSSSTGCQGSLDTEGPKNIKTKVFLIWVPYLMHLCKVLCSVTPPGTQSTSGTYFKGP